MKILRTLRFVVSFTVALGVIVAFSIGGGSFAGWLVSIQFGPALVAGILGNVMAGGAVAVGIMAATVIFGRAYCAAFCPLGTLQECVSLLIRPRSRSSIPGLKIVRFTIAIIACVLLIGGWAVGFRLLDPFSRFGAIVASSRQITLSISNGSAMPWASIAAGVLTLAGIVFLVAWKSRLYCSAICPVGTILGFASRFSMYRVRFTDACKGCGKCERNCPVDCIGVANRQVDAERCILCFNCLSVCPASGLIYGRRRRAVPVGNSVVSPSRRAFLGKGAVIAAGLVFANYGIRAILGSVVAASEFLSSRIFPPGAGDPERFARRCTGCHLCVACCPTTVIKPSLAGAGPVYLDYSGGRCDYDCAACGTVCPTGALKPLPLVEKQYTRIGRGEVALHRCRVVTDNQPCDLCAQACPVKTIFMVDGPNGIPVPEVNAFHCIGCGACQFVCPMKPSAITVVSIGKQELM